MSKEAITKVVQRAISDAGFRRQLSTDPTGALRGFDLSADEAAALRTGDAGRLSSLGVDQRMSKAFALGGASVVATRQAGTDLSTSGGSALSNADATGATGSVRSALVSGSDANQALIDGGAAGARTIIPTEPGSNLTADADGAAGSLANADADDSSEAYLTKVGYDADRAANADASGGSASRSMINDDPDGFLAANARADISRGVTDAHDRGDAGRAANADASGDSASRSMVNDDPDGFLAANANADLSGGASGDGTAFLDESEAYLSKVGYDASAAESAVTDAHDRGDGDLVTRIADDGDAGGTSASSSDGGPNLSS